VYQKMVFFMETSARATGRHPVPEDIILHGNIRKSHWASSYPSRRHFAWKHQHEPLCVFVSQKTAFFMETSARATGRHPVPEDGIRHGNIR
jgi:hypothetical protein